jgi:hypothetical protein
MALAGFDGIFFARRGAGCGVVEGEAHPENRMIPSNKQNYHFHDSSAVSPKTFKLIQEIALASIRSLLSHQTTRLIISWSAALRLTAILPGLALSRLTVLEL